MHKQKNKSQKHKTKFNFKKFMPLPKTMLNKNQTITPFKPEKKYNLLLATWLALVIVAAFALVAATWIIKKYYEPEFFSIAPQKNVKILPAEVYAYAGVITEIKNDYLIIKALASKNYLLKDQLLMVKIDGETKISRLLIPKTITSQSNTAGIKSTELTKEDLKIGQNITVSSQENIKNKISFTADKIETQIVK
ncbi:hypothetical protein COX27_01615 [Candidatus Kuenenbacteria bacterium CG23_combo_of_CG06-09_8_20_14_all_36_9]|nr:MAG: hypothetical protein COX27_01615 [Candidatus Kuenenbacteria bacterium CG23_combo_of_CG06-09_8_20_14_all_36_9]